MSFSLLIYIVDSDVSFEFYVVYVVRILVIVELGYKCAL